MSQKKSSLTPWKWIPTVYIAEGLPYFAVNTLTVLMYVNLGISKTDMAFFTGWLYLPWVIKPFWSPFVDILGTKRGWTIAMQMLIAITMGAVGLLLPTSSFFATTLVAFWLMAFFSATHDIAADGYYMLELDETQQAAFVGVRSTFYRLASILGQGGLVILAGYLEIRFENIPKAWSITFLALSFLFVAISAYHYFFMPHAEKDKPTKETTVSGIVRNFFQTFVTFFRKPFIWSAILFMLFYRFPEALCIKLIQPFLVDAKAAGGLALTTSQVGFVNGTVGVIALLAGGIVGGIAIARGGLKKWILIMAASLTLPCAVYCVLAIWQPSNFFWICSAIAFEQFGYGFGFTAFMMYLIYFSQGENQTSHYAFCTAFMALGMMLPGMAAGWIHSKLDDCHLLNLTHPEGYTLFFFVVLISSVLTFATVAISRKFLSTLKQK